MGYNTTIMLLNDGLDQLTKDPAAGYKIHEAIRRFDTNRYHDKLTSFGIGNHANMGQVISVRHADDPQVCVVSQNLGREIEYPFYGRPRADDRDLELIADRLRYHGYRVIPPSGSD